MKFKTLLPALSSKISPICNKKKTTDVTKLETSGKVFLRVVYGNMDLLLDDWFFADAKLLHGCLHRESTSSDRDELWYACVSTTGSGVDDLHGHPTADRIKRPRRAPTSDPAHSFTIVDPMTLKKQFVESVSEALETADTDDVLVIIIMGHGEAADGAVNIGRELLRPKEITKAMGGTRARSVTLFVSACYSGFWMDESRRLGRSMKGTKAIGVIVRCKKDGQTDSFPNDATDRARGGYFVGNFVAAAYVEHDIVFPQPPEIAETPMTAPPYNLTATHNLQRAITSQKGTTQRSCR